jgi:transposase
MQTYIGLDTHKNFIVGCVKNQQGTTLNERRFKTEPHEINKFLEPYAPDDSKVALESSSCWQYVYDYLTNLGYKVTLSNPSKTRLIGESKKKTDWEDARKLADLLRSNMLPTSYAAPQHVREERQITRHRASLTQQLNQLKNKVHAILRRHGYNFDLADHFTKKALSFLESLDLPITDRFEMDQYIGLIRHFNVKIEETSQEIEKISDDNPSARVLMSYPGISHYSALMIMAEIGEINRFRKAEQLVGFAGLCPSVSQSGDKCYMGRITKTGSKNLRWILVQCANIARQHDPMLKSFYMKKKLGKGHNKAITATARKLLVNIHVMLTRRITYHTLQRNKAS